MLAQAMHAHEAHERRQHTRQPSYGTFTQLHAQALLEEHVGQAEVKKQSEQVESVPNMTPYMDRPFNWPGVHPLPLPPRPLLV